jgi:chemotaxis receptor (MCP) glutamine deamidase CheD
VRTFCELAGLPIVGESLGGNQRRRILLDLEHLKVLCCIGNGTDFVLWSGKGERDGEE